jgi:TonB family protein
MMARLRGAVAAGVISVLLATTVGATAASLSEARELYAAAAYGEALTMLDALLQTTQAVEERQGIALYRVLCLVALGRRADADRAMAEMIQRDPLYRPTADDIPPRMRAAFVEARRRLLPPIIQQDYAAAKGAFERKEFGTAARAFTHVLKVIAEPDLTAEASVPPLSDLRTLAEGFRDLSATAAESPSVRATASRAPSSSPETTDPNRIYAAGDSRVVPAAVLKQQVPRFRAKASGPAEGVVEVIIDAAGRVETARMVRALDAHYDAQVVSAAKGWQYRPATVNGAPVRFRKQVRISVVVADAREDR